MKSLIFSVIFSAFCFFAHAQKPVPLSSADESHPNFAVPMNNSWLGRFEKRQSHMVKRLGLTTEQKKSLDTLNDHYVVKRAVLQEDKTVARRTRIDSIKVLRKNRETSFKSFLNDAQRQKWDELRKAQKKKTFRKQQKVFREEKVLNRAFQIIPYCEIESCSFINFRFYPYFSSVPFHNFFADC